jgi:hypothetical protein
MSANKYLSILQLKKFALCLGLGLGIHKVAEWLSSDFLKRFYESGLIPMEIILLAINVASAAILLKLIAELPNVKSTHFVDVRRQIAFGIYEQIAIILLTLLLVLVVSSTLIIEDFQPNKAMYYILLTSILVYELEILRDTFHSVVEMIELTLNLKDQNK